MNDSSPKNELLQMLDEPIRRRIVTRADTVALRVGSPLATVGETIETVYFPTRGVVSIVANYDDGSIIEMATIGREGFTGFAPVLGSSIASVGQLVQAEGSALALSTAELTELSASEPRLSELLLRFCNLFIHRIMVSVACNASHLAEQRLSRWLLQMHDRTDGSELTLTHEFLAEMIGVRRATITEAMGRLQERGAVEYVRGFVRIADVDQLERSSCPCYRLVKQLQNTILSKSDS